MLPAPFAYGHVHLLQRARTEATSIMLISGSAYSTTQDNQPEHHFAGAGKPIRLKVTSSYSGTERFAASALMNTDAAPTP